MKKFKRIKWILTSVLLLGILTAGTSFALSDAGAELQAWFDSRFQDKTEEIENNTADYFQTAFTEPLESYTNELSNESNLKLETSADETITSVRQKIWRVTGNYLDDIDAKRLELIEGKLQQNFEEYTVEMKNSIDEVITQKTKYAFEAINSDLDAVIVNMKNDIQDHSQETRDELINTINETKEAIETTIKGEQDDTSTKLQGYIDVQANKHKEEVVDFAAEQVDFQISNIKLESSDIKNEAMQEMCTIVLEIPNN